MNRLLRYQRQKGPYKTVFNTRPEIEVGCQELGTYPDWNGGMELLKHTKNVLVTWTVGFISCSQSE